MDLEEMGNSACQFAAIREENSKVVNSGHPAIILEKILEKIS